MRSPRTSPTRGSSRQTSASGARRRTGSTWATLARPMTWVAWVAWAAWTSVHRRMHRTELGRPSPVARAPQLSVAGTAARASRCAFARRWNGHGRHGHGWHGRHGQLWRQRRRAAAVMKKSAPGRLAPAPPACRGELAQRGRWHLWLLATACYSCRTQEDEGDLGDLGPSDLPVRVRVRVS